ncbi:hypothetical protein HI145_RS01485 [Escherichia coli]|nr:hypothetical protein [Escherichia coli]MED6536663.1 hypothetical protein [Escherichia coli O157]
MKKYIRMIMVFVVFMLYSRFSTAVPAYLDCMGNDGTWHVLSNDPQNGNNIVVDDEVYRFRAESLIGNKKVSTYKSDAGIIANVILIVDPKTKDGDIYIVIYQDSSNKRDQDIDKLNIHCEL